MRTSIATGLVFAIIVSITFCALTTGSMNGKANATHQEQSPFSIHANHMQIWSLGAVAQSGLLSVLIATLLTLLAYAVVMFPRKAPLVLHARQRKRYDQANVAVTDRAEFRWVSRLVRSPEFLRPA